MSAALASVVVVDAGAYSSARLYPCLHRRASPPIACAHACPSCFRAVASSLAPNVAYAVAQQDVAFALCVMGEALNTRENVAEGTPGRPNLAFVGPASGALCGAFALIQSDNELASPAGLALGAVATLALGYQYAKRFDETPRNPLEWPGPRLMPTLGVLFSLFAFLANVEALPRVLSPLAI